MLPPVSQSELLESEKVARVQLKRALQVARCLLPMAFAAVDHAGVSEYISVVGQCAPGDNELAASPAVIAESVVVINGQGEVGFARIRLKAQSGLRGRISQTETGRGVAVAPKVGSAMYSGQQTPSLYEVRIAHDSFIEQLGRLRQLLPGVNWVRRVGEEFLGAQVQVVRCEIRCGRPLDRRLFARGNFGLKLCNCLSGELTFDCEYVGGVAIVPFRPKLGICRCVDQLSADTHSATGTLHGAFQYMRYAERVGDLAHIMLGGGFVLHCRHAADYF